MSYCVNCGVELADSQKKCPLCGVAVFNPAAPATKDATAPYPKRMETIAKKMDRKYFASLALLIMLIPFGVTLISDFMSDAVLSWSAYVTGALAMLFIWVVFPFYFKKYYRIAFVCVDCAALTGYVYLISYLSQGNWFLPIGLPICATVSVFIIALTAIFSRKKGVTALVKTALILFSIGLLVVCLQLLLSGYHGTPTVSWSLYALTPCALIGVAALILEGRRNLKERIRRRLFF